MKRRSCGFAALAAVAVAAGLTAAGGAAQAQTYVRVGTAFEHCAGDIGVLSARGQWAPARFDGVRDFHVETDARGYWRWRCDGVERRAPFFAPEPLNGFASITTPIVHASSSSASVAARRMARSREGRTANSWANGVSGIAPLR